MKKFIKNLFLVMAFAVIAAFAANAEEVHAEDAATGSAITATAKPAEVASGTAIWYNAATDSVEVVDVSKDGKSGSSDIVYQIFVLKEATGNTIKQGAKAKYTLSKGESKTMKELGFSSTTKDAYFFYTVTDLSADKDTTAVKANLIVTKQKAKSLKVTINYAAAGIGKDGVTVLVPAATGYDKKAVSIDVEWSSDNGTTWNPASKFDGKALNTMLNSGEKYKLLIREIGKNGVVDAARTGKPAKVTLAKIAKAPKIKVDVKKSTLNVKNGYDITLATVSGEAVTYDLSKCMTLLPYYKTAKRTSENILTSNFVPADKKATGALEANSVSFTSTKLKALSVEAAVKLVGSDLTKDTVLAVRKSATNKKPASLFFTLTIKAQAAAPFVATETSLDGDNLICVADAKGYLVVPGLYPAGTYVIKEGAIEPANDKAVTDTASVLKYEYIIVKEADISTLDYASTSWKSLKAGGKLKSTASTKYTVVVNGTATKKTAALTDTGAVLLIRRAGVKSTSGCDAVLASKHVVTSVAKGSSGAYEWSVKDQKGITGTAYKLNIWELDEDSKYVCTSSEVTYVDAAGAVKVEIPEGMAIDTTKSKITSGTITATGFTLNKTGKTVVDIYFKKAEAAATTTPTTSPTPTEQVEPTGGAE